MKSTHPNVLFLVIDGMTKEKFSTDERSCKTPNIDSLIKRGCYFSQTVSSGSVTIPSMSSIFSSLYPFECITLDDTLLRFNSNLKNFPKFFEEKNYFTMATIPESLTHTGFTEIFQKTHEYNYPSTLFDGLGEKILDILFELKEPWLYYLHLSDLHNDIDFHKFQELKKFDNENFGDTQIEKMISAFDLWLGKILEKIDSGNTLIIITSDHGHEGLSYNKNMKQFGLDYTHQHFEPGTFFKLGHKVVEKFPDKLSPLRKKLSVAYKERRKKIEGGVTNPIIEKIENSDLKLYEKRIMKNDVNYTSHVYDERFLVPLLFIGLNLPSNKKISQQVRSIDIFPTICEVLGISINFTIKGKSLLPLIQDKNEEESFTMLDSILNSTLSSSSNVIGIRTSKFKYFRDRDDSSKNIHLYDLKSDPHEEHNIASSNKEVIVEMENIFQKINPSKDFTIRNSKYLSESEINNAKDMLKKLGYV